MIGTISVAIGWHRYVLLGEVPARLHVINLDWPLPRYFLMMVQVAIVLLPVFLVYLFVVVPVAQSLLTEWSLTEVSIGFLGPAQLVDMVVNLVFLWIILRLALVLPAAAIGVDLRLGQSFSLTRKASLQLLISAALIVSFNTLGAVIIVAISEPLYSFIHDICLMGVLSDAGCVRMDWVFYGRCHTHKCVHTAV